MWTRVALFLLVFVPYLHADAGEKPKMVEAITVHPTDLVERVKLVGTIKAQKESHITAQVAGIVDHIFAKEGTQIKKGTRLITLKNLESAEAYELAQHNAKIEKEQYERMKHLYENKDISKQALEESKQKWADAKIAVSEAQAALNQTIFSAPFNGTCGVFRVSEGAYVQIGDELVAFYDASHLEVEFSVPEKLVHQINVGMQVHVFDQNGTIISVQRAIDPETQMGRARAKLAQCPHCVIGSHIDVEVAAKERTQAIAVPSEAIFLKDGKEFVYVVKKHKAVLTPIKKGMTADRLVEITDGLHANDVVVTRGHNKLNPGAAVQVHK